MTPLWRVLPDLADRLPESPALLGTGEPVTYARLAAEAAGCAARLRELGVGPGDRVAILAPNSLAFVASFFAIVSVGGVVVCLSPDATPRELAGMIEVGAPAAGISVREVETSGVLDELLDGRVVWGKELEEPAWADGSPLAVPDLDSAAPALVGFTSGSTGRPKGALHRADTLVRAGQDYLDFVLDSKPRRLPANFPMYHLGGIVLVLLPAFLGGGSVALLRGYKVPEVLDALVRHRIDAMLAIPAMVELLFLKGDMDAVDLSALEVVAMGGAPVSNQLVHQVAERFDVRVHVGYGSTECPGFFLVTRTDTPLDDGVGPMVGWLTGPPFEVSIQDDDGASVRTGEIGELCIRSPHLMIEYFGDPEATAAAMDAEGWFHTGDLGSIRHDGAVLIQGRKKEMYIRGGFNVYPAEVEAALFEHPDVSWAAVHALSDEVLGEKGCAWVVPEAGATLEPEALREFAGRTLARYKLPDVIRVVDELPMNAIGKVDKITLRARAESGT